MFRNPRHLEVVSTPLEIQLVKYAEAWRDVVIEFQPFLRFNPLAPCMRYVVYAALALFQPFLRFNIRNVLPLVESWPYITIAAAVLIVIAARRLCFNPS